MIFSFSQKALDLRRTYAETQLTQTNQNLRISYYF